ncbi:MAG TPA: 16S rRNA (uracil(1498)-N(3))-methyltransferase [Candidatus Dormibacteraeota bacterium]|jgi:16S rRNA (uracil1498-N3)-methyltransferase|nr:16S rRNA (uracil(1498)-N(3))-methyltransferase [Candidatus Dormibacteraeota bacterium]
MGTMFWTFVEPAELASGEVVLEGPSGHHLARVLRVRPGERGVVVGDGREHDVEVTEVRGSRIAARVTGERPVTAEPGVAITLFQAVLPNPDFDAVIENGTAVGVRRFVAIQAARSVARPAGTRQARWQLIARSAAEQSHRGEVPAVSGPMTLDDALAHELDESRLLVLDPGAPHSLAAAIDQSSAYTLAVGPEGGWTTDELTRMTESGGTRVNLGPRILRARLAPVVAAAILVQR